MAEWTHNICLGCWREQRGAREPVALAACEVDSCCWCGVRNADGIYQRASPGETPCKGKHADDELADL